jgi:hypothetical protein
MATMGPCCCHPYLPNEKTDLDKLVHWLHEHDADWVSDTLWLR